MSSEPAELTHSQKQIRIGQRLHPRSPLYNMAFAFVFQADLRPDLFREAWRRVADASDALRTEIVDHGATGAWRLRKTPSRTEALDFCRHDDPEAEFLRWCRQRCRRPLPLDGELVDSVLVALGEGRTGWYLNQHHLITDAWSTRLLYQQVGTQYEALLHPGVETPGYQRSPFGLQQALPDYYPIAGTLISVASKAERAKALEHWIRRQERPGRRTRLYGHTAEPSDTASIRWTLELDEGRSRALDALARQDGFVSLSADLSRFALLATLLVGWLHRVSGGTDLGFDAPVTGRPTAEAKRTLGLFIEMFPFAATVESGDTFRSLGARCLEEAKRLLRFALPGTSSPTGATASNVVLNFFPASFGPFAGAPADVEWVHPGHGDSVHALRLQVHDFSGSGRYVLHFDFNEGALPHRFRQRGLAHFEKLLDACIEDPDRPIATVDLLTENERQALSRLNATDALPPARQSVVAMFEARARLDPNLLALREKELETSFADLLEESEQLALSLIDEGVEPGDRVAVLSWRSDLAVIAVLAVLRARGVYVPIDPLFPRARADHILRDSGAKVLLVGEGVGPVAEDLAIIVPIADGIRAGEGKTLEHPGPALEDPAYLIYTSGSTGRPKGVLVEHGGLADYLDWASRQYVRGDRLSFPLFTSLTFDLTVTSLFLPLITGGTLEIYPEGGGPVDTAIMDVARADAIDFIKLTPSHLSLLSQIGLEGSRIRRMVVGGENFTTHLASQVSAQLGHQVEIYNEYGPTEAVVGCVMHRYDPEADIGTNVAIGVPADHVEVEVLNEARSPVPVGIPGELWISRFGLARGYHGLEELTAQCFEEHPHRPGKRRYRTGDRVRLTDSGKLEYLGRLDRQLKVAGWRVEPNEIEAALLSVPGVEQCAVIARRHRAAPPPFTGEIRHCIRCGLASNYPRVVFDQDGVCGVCRSYDGVKDHARAYFKTMDDLRALFETSARSNTSPYDCMMLYSGGKDSTYALCRLAGLGLSVYAFTLDNGFISDGAKANIRKVTEQLGVEVELATTPAMNAIFRDSLKRFSNVCNGCFKTIYTLSMKRARELGIPIVVTGLSRGQMFETRLSEEMFRGGRYSAEEVDAAVLAARKVYHRTGDEVSRSLNVSLFQDDQIFEEVRFVDFYRYCDVELGELYDYLGREVPWLRPQDTGRSTNCLINDLGIHVHKKERGYHNYALPYSWDVRLGHKTLEAARDELEDEIDTGYVEKTLAEIGYDQERAGPDQVVLQAFYVASDHVDEQELRRQLDERLPAPVIPGHFRRIESIPLTTSGKVDEETLAREALDQTSEKPYRAPEGPVEEFLAGVWQEELGVERPGADDSLFTLGGTSLDAMQVVLRLCQEFDIDLPLDTMFSHPTLGDLARVAEDRILADVADSLGSELAEGQPG